MLTVIVIIGILAALILAGVMSGRKSVRGAAIKMDISLVDQALDHYRTEYGEYPPDFVGCNFNTGVANEPVRAAARQVVLRHLRKRFPRYPIPSGTADAQFDWFVQQVFGNIGIRIGTVVGNTLPAVTGDMTPSQALVFWLGGLPAAAGSNELTGFSANPANPIASSTAVTSRVAPLMEFDVRRLFVDANTLCLGYGSGTSQGGNIVIGYAYFNPVGNPCVPNASNNPVPYWYLGMVSTMGFGPYVDSRTYDPNNINTYLQARWVNIGKPQVISAGLDGDFGARSPAMPKFPPALASSTLAPLFPSGGNFSGDGHNDDVANFLERATIGDDIRAQ
jgi:type II secretory pathway pseudopilin PulG